MRIPRHGTFRAAALIAACIALAGCSDASIKHYNLGVEAADRGDLELAVSEWKLSLEHRPDDPDALYNLGSALLELGRPEEAVVPLRKASGLAPGDNEVQYAYGKALHAMGDLAEAKKAYKLALAIKPNYFPPYIGLASIALSQGQYKTAENNAARGLSINSRDREGNLILSEAYFRQGNYQEAYAQLLSVRYLYPTDRDFLLLMGKVMSERNMHADALETLGKAKENGATSADLFYYLGKSSLALQRYSAAEKYFQMSLYKDREDSRSLKGLAETELMAGQYEKSLETWTKAERLSPGDPEVELGKGMVLINLRRNDEAVRILSGIVGREDTPPRTLYYLGHALMRTGDKEGARKAFMQFKGEWEGDPSLIREVEDILISLD